ncbi:MAG: DUF4386 family protein [Anaerolineales bacterium]|nr:DUF4386 family protein [Anaerolineales bacterium]
MKTRPLGIVSLIILIMTALWLALLISSIVSAGPVETFEQVLANAARLDGVFYLTYANATLFTVGATILLAGLYVYCKPIAPEWSVIGVVFVPVYCVLNLFSYLSQITVVPRLLEYQQTAEYQAVSTMLLRQMIQAWPGSAVWVSNNLAYAILGIPSIIFGMALCKRSKTMRLAGVLLVLNGIACIVGMVGVVLGNTLIGMGSAVGGGLFFLALFPLSWAFLRNGA